MKSIDFLPDIYRQRETLRRARLWWGIVVLVFSSALGASTIAQALLRHSTQQQLDSLAGEYAAAQTQVQELSTLQAQIGRAGHEANLYTYLENPWPRTQLLAQVVRPLPDCIRLSQIHIAEQESAKTAVQVGPRSTKAEEEAATKATGPERTWLACKTNTTAAKPPSSSTDTRPTCRGCMNTSARSAARRSLRARRSSRSKPPPIRLAKRGSRCGSSFAQVTASSRMRLR